MDARFASIAARAADHHGIVSLDDVLAHGISSSRLSTWVAAGLLERVGPRSLRVAGAPPTWHGALAAGIADLAGVGVVAGRSSGRLLRLDGFDGEHLEYLTPRAARERTTAGVVRSTERPILPGDVVRVDGLPCLSVERMLIEAPLFRLTTGEIERAIDSGIRTRRLSEDRLRARIAETSWLGVRRARRLLDALDATGGESWLERRFIELTRRSGLPTPVLQHVVRNRRRVVARVDVRFGDALVVELEGHATHSSRQQRQADEARRTELVILGHRVLVFTYDDVIRRPQWVVEQVKRALAGIRSPGDANPANGDGEAA